MEEINALFHGFSVALTPYNLVLMFVGITLGVIIGVLPGLGGANGVAILLPSAVYVFGVWLIGIYVSSALFIALFMKFAGRYSWLRSASVGLAVSGAAFVLFEIWFTIPLPKGPVEQLLGY